MVGALELLDAPSTAKSLVLKRSLMYLSRHLDNNNPPSYAITALHRILKRTLNVAVPFADLRRACLEAGIAVATGVEQKSARLSGFKKFKFLMEWAVAANSLDFRTAGVGYGLSTAAVKKTMENYHGRGLAIDQSSSIYAAARAASTIVYIPDNVGELPFDKLLIAALASNGATVTVPLRGGAITSDAVMADALAAGMGDSQCKLILAGPDTLGISFSEMSKPLASALSKADLIIAKGQANYYVLSEFGQTYPRATIACLFTAKCDTVWEAFGCKKKSSIAAIIQRGTPRRRGTK
jgi:hypothetical protein